MCVCERERERRSVQGRWEYKCRGYDVLRMQVTMRVRRECESVMLVMEELGMCEDGIMMKYVLTIMCVCVCEWCGWCG